MSSILFIDAEAGFSDTMVSSLSSTGFEVKKIEDGKEGLAAAKADAPDLIVLCVELPKGSGYSICNKIKKDAKLKGIPLIITSAEATPETFAAHKKLKTHAEEYLAKPYKDSELLEKIGGLIEMPSGGNGASPPPPPDDDVDDLFDNLTGDVELGQIEDEQSLDMDGGGVNFDEDSVLGSLDAALDSELGAGFEDLSLEGALDDLGGLDDESISPPPLVDIDDDDDLLDSLADEPAAAAPPPSAASGGMGDGAALRKANADLESTVARLQAKLGAAEERADKAVSDASASASSTGSSARELLNLKEQIRAKDKELDKLKDEIFEHEKATVDVQESLEQANSQLNAVHSQVSAKDAEVAAAEAKVSALESQNSELEAEVAGKVADLENQLASTKAELEKFKAVAGEVSVLKNELSAAQSGLDVERDKMSRAKQAAEELAASLS